MTGTRDWVIGRGEGESRGPTAHQNDQALASALVTFLTTALEPRA